MKKSKVLNQIEELQVKINNLTQEKNKILEDEEDRTQKPRCRALLGTYLKSSYGDNQLAKIIGIVEPSNGYFYFIMEEINLYDNGGASITINNHYPYLNKEWWGAAVPISGFKKSTEKKYFDLRKKVLKEISTGNNMRKFLLENNKK